MHKRKVIVKASTISLKILQKLVKQRVAYLNELLELDENWISGKSETPNTYAVEMMIAFTTGLLKINPLAQSWHIDSKMLMSPLPTGGVSIEVQHNDFSVSLNIFNTGDIEVEYEKRGHYNELGNLTQENFLQGTNDLICSLIQSV